MKKNASDKLLRQLVEEKKLKGYSVSEENITNSDEEDNSWKEMASQFSTHEKYLEETAQIMEKENPDVFKDHKYKTVADRENPYLKRWRDQKDTIEKDDGKSKSYAEKLQEVQIEREKQEVLLKIEKQKKEEERKRKYEEAKQAQEAEQASKKVKHEGNERETSKARDKNPEKWGKPDEEKSEENIIIKSEPNLKPTGKLYQGQNQFKGVELKWSEPSDVGIAIEKWRLYVYKGGQQIGDPIKVYAQPAYLFGKDVRVVDITIEHGSCSKQHAVLCHRNVGGKVKPYIMDLSSTNGTFLNHKKLDDKRYYELKEFDIIRFGESTREYVLIHEGSKVL